MDLTYLPTKSNISVYIFLSFPCFPKKLKISQNFLSCSSITLICQKALLLLLEINVQSTVISLWSVNGVGTIFVCTTLFFIFLDIYSLSRRAAEILPSFTFTHVYYFTKGLTSLQTSIKYKVISFKYIT